MNSGFYSFTLQSSWSRSLKSRPKGTCWSLQLFQGVISFCPSHVQQVTLGFSPTSLAWHPRKVVVQFLRRGGGHLLPCWEASTVSSHTGKVPASRRDEGHLYNCGRSRGVYRDTVFRNIHPDVPNHTSGSQVFSTSNLAFMSQTNSVLCLRLSCVCSLLQDMKASL